MAKLYEATFMDNDYNFKGDYFSTLDSAKKFLEEKFPNLNLSEKWEKHEKNNGIGYTFTQEEFENNYPYCSVNIKELVAKD